MGDQQPTFLRAPLEDLRVARRSETDILDADNIEVGQAADKTAEESAVQILVRSESKHPSSALPCHARVKACSQVVGPKAFTVLTA